MLGHGVLILIPVVLLGVALSLGIRGSAAERGLSEARTESVLVAQTAVEPHLDGSPLAEGLTARERRVMRRLVDRAVASGHLLRLRLRDQDGHVVYADDGDTVASDPGAGDAATTAHSAEQEQADD